MSLFLAISEDSKVKGLKNDRNNCRRNNTHQNKLQYWVYVIHGETNTLNTHFPDHATSWGHPTFTDSASVFNKH